MSNRLSESPHFQRYVSDLAELAGARVVGPRRMTDQELRKARWTRPAEELPLVLTLEKDGREFALVPSRDAEGHGCGWLYVEPVTSQ